ncbi:Rtr1/RPAP2 family-domain-containing protein [Clohesyomyces aquaticus]|uniref:RNA polymerase II subunit B1 CTD phosphatase RPAP2 homolog n=1 Tax=Clohesyomyces aquaticus TaxID=1231657 RepID=A0A1Y1Z6P7_9PLEO|nr:Rtr1/RPAP2 family-domain-containing protein [Clohesyomyces aquaticus]
MTPKSILKNSTVSTNEPSATSKPYTQRHRDVALQHASIIEEQKRVEKEVLDAIMTLMDFPTSPTADPMRPSPSDALFFQGLMVNFQPSDYDSLIEERNIADRCGYALCPRPKKKAPSKARKHFIETDKGVEIVDRRTLEVWCSDDCARRALYVKVQLSEEPAWMRRGGVNDKIELLVENAEDHHKALPLRLKQEAAPKPAKSEEEEDVASAWAARDDALADLALERGEKPGRLSKANKDLLRTHIQERVQTAPSVPPEPPTQLSGQSHMAIEGHIPRADRPKDEDEEDDGTDWDKHLPG